MKMIEEKLKNKLLKLYELAKRGVDGEKVAASLALDRMLKKYGLTLSDIDSDTPKERRYKYTDAQVKMICVHIVLHVMNSKKIFENRKQKTIIVNVTDYQHVQILEQIDFHIENYKREKKAILGRLTSAYVNKHRLFADSDEESEEMSIEALREMEKSMRMQLDLSDRTYQKKLN